MSVKPAAEAKATGHPRKMEIAEAAVTCFLERGYHQTGVRDIAARAGVSLGNLYNHFRGKEAVLAFIAELEGQELSDFVTILGDGEHPAAALRRFVDAYSDYAARPENALLGVEILTEALRNPVIAGVFAENRRILIDALAGCLRAGTQGGEFAACRDHCAVARMILDTIEGHGLRAQAAPPRADPDKQALVRFIFNGVGADGSG